MRKARLGTHFGRLVLKEKISKDVFLCECICGEQVLRTTRELEKKRLQTCYICRAEFVEEVLEWKERDRKKDAHDQSIGEEGAAVEESQEECTSSSWLPPSEGGDSASEGHRAEETQLCEPQGM